MKDKKTELFAGLKYYVPADFEKFMEKNAAEGWNVDKIHQWSSVSMTFQKTEPKKYRYVIDLNAFPTEEYKETYRQFGWEYMGRMASMYVWRKEYTDERPEAFTDCQSVRKRSMNVFWVLTALNIFLIASMITLTILYFGNYDSEVSEDMAGYSIAMILLATMTAMMLYVSNGIYKNRQR